jgi:hypothetical protein
MIKINSKSVFQNLVELQYFTQFGHMAELNESKLII